tara:strand:+ start:24043 stop:25146 length:1104 start_codon:yes stop_codon:yes gene_type:complete
MSWALTRADKNIDQLQSKQGLEKLPEWLSQQRAPTLKQLEKFAKAVYVPLGYLFLPEPPVEELPLTFFRSAQNPRQRPSLSLYQTVQKLKQRQDWLVDFKKDQGHDALDFVGAFTTNSNVHTAAQNLYNILKIPRAWYWEIPNREASLKYLIEKVEAAGIFTTFSGVVNANNKRPIDRNEFRGFALVNEYAPFVFVNSNDAKSAQIFTLMHEVAHILVGASTGTDLYRLLPTEDPIEQFCDDVASEFLVPTDEFVASWQQTENFNSLSRKFKVSTLLLAKKAMRFELISIERYLEHYREVMAYWQTVKNSSESTSGNYYYTKVRRVGAQFARYVDSAVKSDQLLYRDAYQLLNMKGDSYQRLVTEFI